MSVTDEAPDASDVYGDSPPEMLDSAEYDGNDDFDGDAEYDASDEDDFDEDVDAADDLYDGTPPPIAEAADEDDPDFSTELPGVPLTDEHRGYLIAQGIAGAYLDSEHAASLHRSATDESHVPPSRRHCFASGKPHTGIWFGFSDQDGKVQWQLRPDHPRNAAKYLSRKGGGSPCGVLSRPLTAPPVGHTVLIVEGTKQSRATAAALAHDSTYVVVGICGCDGWVRDGNLQPVIANAIKGAASVVVIPDADAGTKTGVYDAMDALRKALNSRLNGKRGRVSFVRLPGGGNTGMDDLLAQIPELERADYVRELVAEALPSPADKRPNTHKSNASDGTTFYSRFDGGLKPAACADELIKRYTLALDAVTNALYQYVGVTGVYAPVAKDSSRELTLVTDFLVEELGDDFRADQPKHVEAALLSKLRRTGRVIPERPTHGLLPVRNGLVDMETGELLPHGPENLITVRLDVDYDASATCPTIENWAREATTLEDGTNQFDILIDTTSTLLDVVSGQRSPDRGLYLLGEPRAGKGTYLNGLIGRLVPREHTSSLSLMDLAERKSALILTLYRKVVNLSGETPEGYVADSSVFKSMLGMDPITADVKYKDAIVFYNSALPIFTANDMPHISDVSGAVGARLTFVIFPKSNAGKEDRGITERLQAELPGFLNLLVKARNARKARGWAYLPSAPQAVEQFVQETNPIADFMRECVELPPSDAWRGASTIDGDWGTSTRELYSTYKSYTYENGGKAMKSANFKKAITRAPFKVKPATTPDKRRVWACRLKDDEED